MMPEAVYTVRVPDYLSHFRSADVRAMFEAVRRGQQVRAASDPGAGEKFLRLTLPRFHVTAIQKFLSEESASVALRRFIASFTVTRSLPAANSIRPQPAHPVNEGQPSEKRAESFAPSLPSSPEVPLPDYDPDRWWARWARPNVQTDDSAGSSAPEPLVSVKWEYFLLAALFVALLVFLYQKLRD